MKITTSILAVGLVALACGGREPVTVTTSGDVVTQIEKRLGQPNGGYRLDRREELGFGDPGLLELDPNQIPWDRLNDLSEPPNSFMRFYQDQPPPRFDDCGPHCPEGYLVGSSQRFVDDGERQIGAFAGAVFERRGKHEPPHLVAYIEGFYANGFFFGKGIDPETGEAGARIDGVFSDNRFKGEYHTTSGDEGVLFGETDESGGFHGKWREFCQAPPPPPVEQCHSNYVGDPGGLNGCGSADFWKNLVFRMCDSHNAEIRDFQLGEACKVNGQPGHMGAKVTCCGRSPRP
jgi:hypothetical protein